MKCLSMLLKVLSLNISCVVFLLSSEMAGEKCDYYWNIPNNFQKYVLSDVFPTGESIFKWDLYLNSDGFVALRCSKAPKGGIRVWYLVKLFNFDPKFKETINAEFSNYFAFNNDGVPYRNGIINHRTIIDTIQTYIPCYTGGKIVLTIYISAHVNIGNVLLIDIINAQNLVSTKLDYFEQLFITARKDSEFLEVKIQVESIEIKAHTIILIAVSPVFRAMLTNEFMKKNSGCIKIYDLQEETARLMIDFIYKDHVELSTCRLAGDLLRASVKYGIQQLRKICINYLENQLNQDNVSEILHLAEMHNETNLKERAIKYHTNNPKK